MKEFTVGFHFRNWILSMECFRFTMLNLSHGVMGNSQSSNLGAQDRFQGGENMICLSMLI